jgi:hypothetical protein
MGYLTVSYEDAVVVAAARECTASHTIARTVLEDIFDKPIQIQSYCAVARLHGV